jgi:hypothetical protein
MVVGEFSATLVIGHALDARRVIADAGDDQGGGDFIGFACALGGAGFVEDGPLDD